MKYRNKRTGAVIDTFGTVCGSEWEKVEKKSTEADQGAAEKAASVKRKKATKQVKK